MAMQIGTPYYLSPEICENKAYGAKSDMWSLGCILFELISFGMPFTGRDLMALVRAITHSPIPRLPSQYASSVPLNKLVQSLLCRVEPKRMSTSEALEQPFLRDIVTSLDPTYSFKHQDAKPSKQGTGCTAGLDWHHGSIAFAWSGVNSNYII
jgi:serine/threonine protein kinase